MKMFTVIYRKPNEDWKVMKQFKDEMPAKLMEKNMRKECEVKIIKLFKMQRNSLVKI